MGSREEENIAHDLVVPSNLNDSRHDLVELMHQNTSGFT